MSLPPSGWYPDPYRTPGLLRWWDGAGWTQHTHTDEAVEQAQPAPTSVQPSIAPTAVQSPVQATRIQPSVDATAVQSPVPPTTIQPQVDPTAVQSPVPSTAIQPQLPPAGYDVNGLPGGYDPYGLPGGYDANGMGAGGVGASGTQVLFVGDSWPSGGMPAGPGQSWGSGAMAPGGLGGPGGPGNRYGYLQARRRRRMWMMSGLAAGTAVAVGLIAVIVANLASSAAPSAANHPATHHAASPSTAPAASVSPTTSASPSAPASVLTDAQSGLSYTQLSSPWQAGCPSALNTGSFTWTGGESAVAGQVNGGQTTWYGEACSGPLPQQYGYNGVADLANTATNLANTFQGTYYNTLAHSAQSQLSQPVQVSGHAGWEVKFLISYTNATAQGATWADEDAAVVVVDTGTGNVPVVFFTSIPANLGESNVDSLVSSLTLSVVPGTSGSPGAGGSPAPGQGQGGSPDPGNGNPGNGGGNGHGGGGGGGNNP